MKITTIIGSGLLLFLSTVCFSQHSNEFYNDGALVHVQAGAEVHVWGDVHNYKATGDLQNNGLLKVQGNMYSDDLFRQQGTGTTRIENSDVNVGERQFISGSYAVRDVGSSAKGTVADGSFYDLELLNDQGMVYLVNTVGGAFDKYVADVRNSVHYNLGAQMNRIICADIGMTGAITYPANGSSYPSVFGMMNPTSPLGGTQGWRQNTVQMSGNMSGVDWGYVQGKMRQQIDATTGRQYPFVLGVEPGAALAQRGMQYARIDFQTGVTYDVLEGYFESGLSNGVPAAFECTGSWMNYFGGTDHGQWVIDNPAGGTGTYEVWVWPQDDNFPFSSVWLITKDNSFQGNANECGPSPVGLTRGGFNGFSTFGVAAEMFMLPIEFLDINAQGIVDHIAVTWNVASELNLSHYELERSEDAITYEHISDHTAVGTTQAPQTYSYDDYDVRYFQNYYYRVKSVDNDGSYEYTPVVVASIQNGSGAFDENSVYLFPNPSSDDFMLLLNSNQDLDVAMEVFNSMGQIIMVRQLNVLTGNSTFGINSNEWAPGVYYIQLKEAQTGATINKRFVKY